VRLTLKIFGLFRAKDLDVSQMDVQQKHLASRVKFIQRSCFRRHAKDASRFPAEMARSVSRGAVVTVALFFVRCQYRLAIVPRRGNPLLRDDIADLGQTGFELWAWRKHDDSRVLERLGLYCHFLNR